MQEDSPIKSDQTENLRSLESAIEKDLGLKLTVHRKTEKGVSSDVYEATLDDKIVFVRICKTLSAFEGEIFGYDLLRKNGIPVPAVIASQDKPLILGKPVIILSSAPGVAIKDSDLPEERKELIYEDIVRYARTVLASPIFLPEQLEAKEIEAQKPCGLLLLIFRHKVQKRGANFHKIYLSFFSVGAIVEARKMEFKTFSKCDLESPRWTPAISRI